MSGRINKLDRPLRRIAADLALIKNDLPNGPQKEKLATVIQSLKNEIYSLPDEIVQEPFIR